jgi:ABC-type lipoprotein release transport system permease subunit
MSVTRLVLRSATYHWRTNLAVVLGVAAAVSVLGGALLVGDSVRGSLRDLVLARLGRTEDVVASPGFFREALAADLAAHGVTSSAPLIVARGFVTHEPSGRRATGVLVYGVDNRFWTFHGAQPHDGVFVSPALAAELSAGAGDVLLTRLQKPSDIPLESLFAHKDDIGRTVRLSVAGALTAAQLGEFALQPQQSEVRAVFAPLRRLQRDLGVPDQVNTVLVGGTVSGSDSKRALRDAVRLEDLSVKVSVVAGGAAVVAESAGGVVNEALEQAVLGAARDLGHPAMPLFTYLANSIRIRDRQVPYSLVSGIDLRALPGFDRVSADAAAPPEGTSTTRGRRARENQVPELAAPIRTLPPNAIVLNEWTAGELGARIGDPVTLDFYLWDAAAGLRTGSADFTLAGVVPISGLAADRRLAPEYPGITQAESVSDWDPPFPLDLSRVRPQDEQYWRDHRTTPKAFLPYERARDLWATRYGNATGFRFAVAPGEDGGQLAAALRQNLQERLAPGSQGLTITPARAAALEASSGATDFGEYFTYFSFFIVVSALLLVILFFRLGIEQRLRQIGILRATGYTQRHLRWMFSGEAVIVSLIGGLLGTAGAVAYARGVVHGLATWWVGAVGTTLLEPHITAGSLLIGLAGGVAASLFCVMLSLRTIARRSPRSLLGAHSLEQPGVDPKRARRSARFSLFFSVVGLALMLLGLFSRSTQAGAFFGAGAALLTAFLFVLARWLRARDTRMIRGRGPWTVSRLGFRGAAFRPARSVLSAALIAAAAFIIVSVDAFRRGGGELTRDRQSGTGGYVLLAQSDVPIVENPDTQAGREALLVQSPELARASFARFRLRPGNDVSCLNLYRPSSPTIIAPEASFLDERRFAFSASMAATDEERENPWLLLRRKFDDGAIPAVADATSLQYVLHASVGDSLAIDPGAATPVTLRFVGALRDSVLQGELIIGEEPFVRLFPGSGGFRFFLIDSEDVRTDEQAAALAGTVERELQPFGVDAVSTTERLAAFHRVENTYLSTFQALGGLGLLLGTVGLAAVMFRNVLERRRELALLRAVGYDRRHVRLMIVAETAFLLVAGLLAGVACALIAVIPAWLSHGGRGPGRGLVLLVAAIAAAGIVSAAAATRAAVSGRLLDALRAE